MKKQFKRIMSLALCIAMVFTSTITNYASDKVADQAIAFGDVVEDEKEIENDVIEDAEEVEAAEGSEEDEAAEDAEELEEDEAAEASEELEEDKEVEVAEELEEDKEVEVAEEPKENKEVEATEELEEEVEQIVENDDSGSLEEIDEPKEELVTDDIEASPSEITDDYNEVTDNSVEETDEEIATPSEIVDEDVNEATPSDVINEEVPEEINEQEATPSEMVEEILESTPSEMVEEILESTPSEVVEDIFESTPSEATIEEIVSTPSEVVYSDVASLSELFLDAVVIEREIESDSENVEKKTAISVDAGNDQKVQTYTVSFNTNGGTKIASIEISKGGKITNLTNPTKSGYKFSNWYKDSTFKTVWNLTTDVVTKNITLYAKWTEKSYKVTYDLNSGAWVSGYKAPASRKYTKTLTLPVEKNITRKGYTFKGWYTDSKFKTKVTSIAAKNENVTVYAKWAANTYKVTYTLNSGKWKSGYTVPTTRKYDKALTLPVAPNIVRTGYTFAGWYTDSKFKTKVTSIAAKKMNVTVYAKWTENKYKVTYNLNSGKWTSGYTAPISRKYTKSLTLPVAKNIKRTGYTFGGWYTDSKFKTKITSIAAKKGNITVYAKWTENKYKVTYNLNSGKWKSGYIAPTSRKYTKAITLPVASNITRTGYTFNGWYIDSKFTTKITSVVAKKGNVTVYAKWTINTYTVKFVPNDSSVIADQKIKYNNLAKVPTLPKKTGYVINKWYKDSTYKTVFDFAKTKITKNITLYGKWEKQKFSVTFETNGGTSATKQTITYGSVVREPKVTRSGYHLVGWYTDSSFKTKWNFSTKLTKKITLYARWITKSQAETNAINAFKKAYITSTMTDFEKEMKIVGWMVENIEYDYDNYLKGKIPQDSYDSYGALVLHKCVCDGYSKAFMKLAEACGLTVARVTGTAYSFGSWGGHAWNQIKLDNKWYNVDVTWEDPVYDNPADSPYNMDHLRCKYINVTDAQLKKDHKWSGANACTSIVYGPRTAFLYNKEGILKKSLKGDTFRALVEKYDLDRDYDLYMNENLQLTDAEGNMKYDDGRNNIPDMTTASKDKIANYVKSRLESGSKLVYITTPKNSSVNFSDLFFDYAWFSSKIGDYDFYLSFGNDNSKYRHCVIKITN